MANDNGDRWIPFGLVILLLGALFIPLFCAEDVYGHDKIPSGYYSFGRDMAHIQMIYYGKNEWSSLMLAQIEVESGWQKCPTSPAGARGPAQFIRSTQEAIENKYNIGAGDICDPEHAAKLQALLLKENARTCGNWMKGYVPTWACAFRTYNGSPRNFWREHALAGFPDNTIAMEAVCVRLMVHCKENWSYPHKIFARWSKYLKIWQA